MRVVNKLIDNEKDMILPKESSDKELANKFLVYFKEKIEKIRASFTPSPERKSMPINPNIVKWLSLNLQPWMKLSV